MQDQSTCRQCGAEFDRSIRFDGTPRVAGRFRVFCSETCKATYGKTHRDLGGERSWPRSAAIEQEVCERYDSGLSVGSISEIYGVAAETISRTLKRCGKDRRSRNAPTLRKRYKGGRITDRAGYACVRIYPDDPLFESLSARGTGAEDSTGAKYVPEHRLVMARAMGRALTRHETVHHKNGIRTDNRLENLELWATVHSGGQRVEDLARFVVENYPEVVRALQLGAEDLDLSLF